MFYLKLIETNILIQELDSLGLKPEEKAHLTSLIDSSIHHAIIDEVLSNLSDEDKKDFLKLLDSEKNHDKVLEFLNSKVDRIEQKIKSVADSLVSELHADIKAEKDKK